MAQHGVATHAVTATRTVVALVLTALVNQA